ncbi:hypothetical protein AKJ54_00530 [candidate division MSBL1 archaeon SCGC-AAA382K21]|uniref:Thiamine biosynthesis protein ThiS n=1 Tax=candidate division MSBL1 archaeon SCGC-AAA382K21 TaxID=1698283 RepID=A0A133VLC2_9EURY|nr:hypothetical protein AKJ54_00530 [candidate division MSBL1 archaeon SCGC-AAA382K21]
MKVKIENSTNLEELKLERDWEVELSDGSTMEDLLVELGLKRLIEEDGSVSSLVMMFKNKKAVQKTDENLEDGDKLKIMPLASGG